MAEVFIRAQNSHYIKPLSSVLQVLSAENMNNPQDEKVPPTDLSTCQSVCQDCSFVKNRLL